MTALAAANEDPAAVRGEPSAPSSSDGDDHDSGADVGEGVIGWSNAPESEVYMRSRSHLSSMSVADERQTTESSTVTTAGWCLTTGSEAVVAVAPRLLATLWFRGSSPDIDRIFCAVAGRLATAVERRAISATCAPDDGGPEPCRVSGGSRGLSSCASRSRGLGDGLRAVGDVGDVGEEEDRGEGGGSSRGWLWAADENLRRVREWRRCFRRASLSFCCLSRFSFFDRPPSLGGAGSGEVLPSAGRGW
jgi:hypothetical protein